MSDGPYRSLPMRRPWRRLAECGDNRSFAPDEVSAALIPALKEDCREELPSGFVDRLCGVFRDQESSLFKADAGADLEALRELAGTGIGRVVLDRAIQLSAHGETGLQAAINSMTDALTDRAARGARQVEEHFRRESTDSRGINVRARIEAAIGSARPSIGRLAHMVLKVEPGSPAKPLKKQELDDGVSLR